ncbi:MAG: hypothetical protein OEM02_15705 [Desulfobulbaceae bacterium]|nr:hypothetical protein [Desulfobulbaceae bacterium]
MTKTTLIVLVILLFLAGFIIVPFLLSGDDSSAAGYENENGSEFDYDSHHTSRSARSRGGSRSFRSGK